MLIANNNQNAAIKTVDSTVYVTPGAVQVGNFVMEFGGGYKTFNELTQFDGTANTYQRSVLGISNFNNFPELNVTRSALVPYPENLGSVYVADATTSKSIGFFTFFYDGTNIVLKSSYRVS